MKTRVSASFPCPEPRASARAAARRLKDRKKPCIRHHLTGVFFAVTLVGLTPGIVPVALAQEGNAPTSGKTVTPEQKGAPTDAPAPSPPLTLDAYDSVHEGNRLLRAGAAKDALGHYEHAEALQPDAREIAFAEGLSHYQLGEYESARESFQRAWLGQSDALADDALYSEGAAYHAEALAAMDQPEVALERLENAMQRYQSVLAHQPDHESAKDANYKAGAAWRQIKQQMQQQQQQNDSKDDKKDNKDKQDQQQDSDQQQNRDQKNEDQQSEEQKNQNQNQDNQDKPSQDQQEPDDAQEQESKDPKDSQAQQNEDKSDAKEPQNKKQSEAQQQQQEISREQAKRKLREMMQAQRQRQKNRKKHRAIVPVRPADKDW